MLTNRMYSVLDYLNTHHQSTYKQISDDLEVKIRYVRYDLDKINDYLYLCRLPQIEKKPKGVVIFPKGLDISLLISEDQYLYSVKERLSLILLTLLLDYKQLKMNKLSQEFQVSRSTIKNDMTDLEKQLSNRELYIQYTDHFEIVGDEKSIVSVIVYELSQYIYLLKNPNIQMNCYEEYAYELIMKFFEKVPVDRVLDWIDKILEKNHQLNDEGYAFFAGNVLLLAYYTLNKKAVPYTIGFDASRDIKKYNKEIMAFEKIIYHEMTGYYRGTLIRLLEYLDNYDGLYNYVNPLQIQTIISTLVENMSKRLKVDFHQDLLLLESLSHHVVPLLKRLFTQRYMYHNSKIVIPESDQYVYDALEQVLDDTEDLHLLINEDEKTYLAVHFIVSVNRLKKSSYKKIAIVCNFGYGSSTMLKETLQSEYQVEVVHVIPHYKLSTIESLEEIDYIISTLPLKQTYGKKNVIVSPLLTQQDYTKLDKMGFEKKKVNIDYFSLESKLQFLEGTERKKVIDILQRELGQNETKLTKNVYKLSDLLKEQYIEILDQNLDWESSILESSNLLEKELIVEEGYGQSIIYEIEKNGFYCVTDNLFALFHGSSDIHVHQSGISLVVNKQAVLFGEKQAKVVFCLASKDKKDQIPAMILLMRMVKKTDFLNQIENAKTTEEVYDIIKICERKVQ